MINIDLTLSNPWSTRWRSLYDRAGVTPFKNKFWEFQFMETNDIVGLEFHWTTRQDHAGIRLGLKLLGYEAHFQVYDNRHWNYQDNRWESYEDI